MKRMTLAIAAILSVALATGEATAQESTTAAAPGRAVSVEGGKYTALTVPEFRAMAETSDAFVVNVHVPFEGDLPNTDASIPFNEIQSHLDQLPASKSARILLYCRSGRMSAIAAEELVKLGYTGVHDLPGGFNAWVAAGLPMAE